MANTNNAAAYCGSNIGLDFDGGLQIGDSVADVRVTKGRRTVPISTTGGGFLQQVENALQKAMHPGSVDGVRQVEGVTPYASGAQVIPFPVVSPYRPLTATRVPVAGLTAFPHKGYYFNGEPVSDFNVQGDEEETPPPGHESLGFIDPGAGVPSGVSLWPESQPVYSSGGPTRLQTVLGTIATTLPATISALKGRPYYDPSQGLPYLTRQQQQAATGGGAYYPEGTYAGSGAGADIGSRTGAAVGGIGDAIGGIVRDHPYLVIGGGLALVLLFMSPPRRR